MIKLQFKLPQTLRSRGFTRRTVLQAPAFQQKGINRLMDIYKIWNDWEDVAEVTDGTASVLQFRQTKFQTIVKQIH